MGNLILQVSETKWKDLRDDVLKQEGWFVPSLHIKYAQAEASKTKRIKELCSRWLTEKFNMSGEIKDFQILEQEEIDKTLGLVCVRFSFSSKDGRGGDSVAFIDAAEVRDLG